MSHIVFTETGFAQYVYWQGQDKKTLRKINRLLQSISRDGALVGEGKPERLRHKDGEYSRRIDETNRLVYMRNNLNVFIIDMVNDKKYSYYEYFYREFKMI